METTDLPDAYLYQLGPIHVLQLATSRAIDTFGQWILSTTDEDVVWRWFDMCDQHQFNIRVMC